MLPLSPVLNMRSRRVAPPALPTPTGLDFPSNDDPDGTVQFRFTSTARPTIVPLSMIWKFRPRQQTGYYTTFFHARGDGTFIGDNTYFGCHPYPKTGTSAGTTHWWEVSIEGADDVTDENANDTTVEYDRWYSQFAVSQNVASQGLVDFYYDLDAGTSRRINHTMAFQQFADATDSPCLVFGDAPWSINNERLSGVLRSLVIVQGGLTTTQATAIHALTSDAAVVSYCAANGITPWYVNINPTPDDISDKSGAGNSPAWINANRPTLWTG